MDLGQELQESEVQEFGRWAAAAGRYSSGLGLD
jgi:hypothetical protein